MRDVVWEGPVAPDFVFRRGEPGYPEVLAELVTPPAELHGLGALPPLDRAVAIVGTRACSLEAEEFTRRLAADLAGAGATVVSGGARGIDAAAHEGAIEAGGLTLVVLPNYLDAPYPARNRPLFRRVLQGGGTLLTEATGPCGPTASRCVNRNRIIAALCSSVVVVQAPARSGANATASVARQLGRGLWAVPASPWDPRGAGNLRLLEAGARICTGARDVLSLAAIEPPGQAPSGRVERKKHNKTPGFDEDQGAVLKALSLGPRGVEELCDFLALGADRVQRSVLTLLLSGAIQEVSGGRYRRTGR